MIYRVVPIILSLFLAGSLTAQPSLSFFGEQEKINVEIEVDLTSDIVYSGKSFIVNVEYLFPPDYYQALTRETFYLELSIGEKKLVGETLYPPLENRYYSGSVTLTYKTTLPPFKEGEKEVSLLVKGFYQACDEEGICFLPSSVSETVVLRVEKEPVTKLISTLLKLIVVALAGGLILNFMPCTLPLIPIRIAQLSEQRSLSKKKILFNGLLFSGGVVLAFFLLALALALIRYSGQKGGWGFQMQNPLYITVMAVLLYLLALSQFNLFLIQLPEKGYKGMTTLTGLGGPKGSFFTGFFAVLIASSCTAPLLGSAAGYLLTRSTVTIFLFFISVGVGFSAPYLLLSLSPKALKKIPAMGRWSALIKELIGFLLLGVVVYLLATLNAQVENGVIPLLVYLLFLTFLIRISAIRQNNTRSNRGKKAWRILFFSLMVSGLIVVAGRFTEPLQQREERGSSRGEPFSEELIDRYRATGTPIFLKFTADWCTTCKINDALVLNSDEIEELFEREGVKLIEGDFTLYDAEIAVWLERWERGGVPFYLYFPPYREPVPLPTILTKNSIRQLFN